jgi:CDP-diacylglycerol--glycerol-3-phosphate 3-phosphatidyltransferase
VTAGEPAAPHPAPAPHRVSSWNIANYLTVLRLLLVPVFAWALLHDDGDSAAWRWFATGVFVIAASTDRVDGSIARSRGLVTSFGKLADPIADKALVGTAFVALSLLGELWWWVTAVVLAREIGITVLRFLVIRHGVMPASRGGKVKTVLQGVAIGLYCLPLSGLLASGRTAVMAVAVAVTVVTGADYVVRAVELRTTSERAETKRARRTAR